MKLLAPLQLSPSVEFLSGWFVLRENKQGERKWQYQIDFYVEPINDIPIVIPFHRCQASIEFVKSESTIMIPDIKLRPPYVPTRISYSRVGEHIPTPTNLSKTIEHGSDELIVYGSGRVIFTGYFDATNEPPDVSGLEEIKFSLNLLPNNALVPTRAEAILNAEPRRDNLEGEIKRWVLAK